MTLRGPVIELADGPLAGTLKEWISGREVMQFIEQPPLPDRFDPNQRVLIEPLRHHNYRRGTGKNRDRAFYIEQ